MRQPTHCSGDILGVTGELSETADMKQIEWKIPFFSLSKKKMHYYKSDSFTFARIDWHLAIYPGGDKYASLDNMSLFLVKESAGDIDLINYSLGFKRVNGEITNGKGGIKDETAYSNASLVHGDRDFCLTLDYYDRSKIAPSNVVTVVCMMWQSDPRNAKSCGNELTGLKALSEDLEAAFSNGTASDMTLAVNGKEYSVHKSLLSAQSRTFATMFEESGTETINIPDCEEESFGLLLKYLYSGRAVRMSFECALQLYFTAQKFGAQELKSFCVKCMANNLSMENFTDVVTHAERNKEGELFSLAQKFFNKNLKKIVLTEKWVALLKENHELANRLIRKMVCNDNDD